jgi:glutamate--cysteine ligase
VDPQAPIREPEDLLEVFREAEQPPARWRIGVEVERFGVDARSGAPLDWGGKRGIAAMLGAIAHDSGWTAQREMPARPLIGLRREDAAITVEPGGQIEISSAPAPDLRVLASQVARISADVKRVSDSSAVAWLATGFHPLARPEDLPWVPKQRYAVMREYLRTRGGGGHDMMQRTASLQVNLDYASETDALRKLRLLLRLAPVLNALFANSPFRERRLTGLRSQRAEVWSRVDPDRTGLLPELIERPSAGYRDYAEWALDVPMLLFMRDGAAIENTGQTFRSFVADGHAGHRATRADWRLHLNTLFPEVRLRSTIEVRCVDALPDWIWLAWPALLVGLVYDAASLEASERLAAQIPVRLLQAARPDLWCRGLAASIGSSPARPIARQLVDIARQGLGHRGLGESFALEPLLELGDSGRAPADLAAAGLDRGPLLTAEEVIGRSRA